MKVLLMHRQTGKTTACIRASSGTGYVIIVPTMVQGEYVKRKAKEMNLEIPEPILFHDAVTNRSVLMGIKGIIIDELNMCVQSLFGDIPVVLATVDTGCGYVSNCPVCDPLVAFK